MSGSSSILELRMRSADGIYAVPYRARRPGNAERLPDGTIAESPTVTQRNEVPADPPPCLELTAGGVPATIHHIYLGLVARLVPFDGVCVLPSGDVAAIYGAEVIAIGGRAVPERFDAVD